MTTLDHPTTEKRGKVKLAPGIYPGMSMADYVNIDAISSHTLMWMDASPAHFHAAMMGKLEREDTDALAFGRAFHTRLLEPETFMARHPVRQPCQAVLASGQRKGEPCGSSGSVQMPDGSWACGTHGKGGESVPDSISQAEFDQIECCVDAVRNHAAAKLLRRKGQCEVVLVGEYQGLAIKGRMDKLILNPCIIMDAKKVAAPTSPGRCQLDEETFGKSIATYGYGVQMGLYRMLVEQQCKQRPEFWWLGVEDAGINAVAVMKPCNRTVMAATNHAKTLLNQVIQCQASDSWPAFGDDVREVSAPAFYLKKWGNL